MTARHHLVLVDTSVFIDFLRGKGSKSFEGLVEKNRVVLSSLVRLELLQGVRKSELKALEQALLGLHLIEESPVLLHLAEEILLRVKGKGLNIGIVDLLIAAEASANNYTIYSADKAFNSLAKLGEIQIFDE